MEILIKKYIGIEYQEYFKTLNLRWIQKYFKVEPADEYVLSNPKKQYWTTED